MFDAFRRERYAEGDTLEVAGCPVRLRVDRRARRISLRIDAAKREVIATAPSQRRLSEAAAFAAQRAEWIGEAVAKLPAPQSCAPGTAIEVLGRTCLLERAATRRDQGLVLIPEGRLRAYGEGDAYVRSATRLLKAKALQILAERTEAHATALGHPMPRVAIMDARSRWGSCIQARGLRAASVRYSWRLILAPWAVMDYVAAHECAHLVHADHSPRFWAVVRELVGEPRPHRSWLRAHGPRLQTLGR